MNVTYCQDMDLLKMTSMLTLSPMPNRGLSEKSRNEVLRPLLITSRNKLSLTQEQMATELDVSLSTYVKWELGKTAPTARSAKSALKRVMDIDIDSMIRAGELELNE